MSAIAFYEKVIKVKADVAAFLINWFSSASPSGLQFVLARLPRCFRAVCLYHSLVRSQKYIDRRFVPLRLSKSCLQPPLSPGFYPHSQGATWGPVHVGVRSQTRPHHNRDGAWRFGCCHLFSDLQGSGDSPQSPEQGEWMSLLPTFPITNRFPRHQRFFCSLDSCLFRDCVG
jgi:hypothetical protein